MTDYIIFFIGLVSGLIFGGIIVYAYYKTYIDKVIRARTRIAFDAIYKERDDILKQARSDAVFIKERLEKVKQNIVDKLTGK